MKKNMLLQLIISVVLIACDTEEKEIQENFEFVTEYTTTVTVGGVIGITERTFEIGEVYEGTYKSVETITIRIAEQTELNNDCPNSSCYQEFLDVPREFLRLME